MALESDLGADYQFQNQETEEFTQSPSSAILYQDDYAGGQSASGSSTDLHHLAAQVPCHSSQFMHGDIHVSVHSNTTNSGISIEESSLITDSNSPLSGASYLRSSGSNITDTLASNCVRISGSSSGNHPSPEQQASRVHQTYQQGCKRQGEPLASSVPLSQFTMPNQQASFPSTMNIKKPRLDRQKNQENSLLPNSQQLLPYSQEFMQSYDPEVANYMLRRGFLQNQMQMQASLSVPSVQWLHMQPHPIQQLPGDPLKQLAALAALNGGICVRRLMYLMFHQRRRPPDNNIDYWRKFVEEYYSPNAKQRWCLSKYNHVGRHAHGVFSQASVDVWKCGFCGSQSKKAFEATFEVLPRLKKIYFDSGIIDELLYLDVPIERKLRSGFMMLHFGKAVQETVYKHFRTVHEGQLRVIFTQELKIISWEFCIQNHEEVISRRLLASQINELVVDAAKCRSNINARASDGVPAQDLLTNCNELATAGNRLAKNLELPLVNDLGFSKQFVRSLQISEIFNCMKDLMTYSQTNNTSPIESLKRYPQDYANVRFNMMRHMEGREHMAPMQNTQDPHWSNLTNANNLQMANLMFQTPTGRNLTTPANYYQHHMSCDTSFQRQVPQQSSYDKVSSCLVSNQAPDDTQMIHELLEFMHSEETKKQESKNVRGKAKLVNDPDIAGTQSIPGGMQMRDLQSACFWGGMMEEGGVGPSTRNLPDCNFIKTESGYDENVASPAHCQKFFNNGHPR